MYKNFRVNYSVGVTKNGVFTPGSHTYLLETVVSAIGTDQARAMIEAQLASLIQPRVVKSKKENAKEAE
jgi:hypothetical protein